VQAAGNFYQLWLANDRGVSPDIAAHNMSTITLTAAVVGFLATGVFADLLRNSERCAP
jgi:hypothetical protein